MVFAMVRSVIVMSGVPVSLVVVSVPVAMAVSVASTMAGLGNGSKVSGLGVLNFGRFDGNSIVDHRNVVGTVIGAMSVGGCVALGLSDGGKVGSLSVGDFGGVLGHSIVWGRGSRVPSTMMSGCWSWGAVFGRGYGSEMSSLSVSDFGSILRHSIVWGWGVSEVSGGNSMMASTSGGMSGKVSGLGVLDFGGIDGHSVVDHWGGSVVGPWVGRTAPHMVATSVGFSVSGKVSSFGGQNFWSLGWSNWGMTDMWTNVVGPWSSVVHSWSSVVQRSDGVHNRKGCFGQVGSGSAESVHRVGGVVDALQVAGA
jgi:hypothetical protein